MTWTLSLSEHIKWLGCSTNNKLLLSPLLKGGGGRVVAFEGGGRRREKGRKAGSNPKDISDLYLLFKSLNSHDLNGCFKCLSRN